MDHKKRRAQEPKQVIVVRKDLKMDYGKFGAQVSHAAEMAYKQCGEVAEEILVVPLPKGSAQNLWEHGHHTKVVLAVKSEEKLLSVYQKALDAGLPAALITDAGFTVFGGVPTNTCVGIGPVFPDQLVGITDKLRLY